MNDPMWMKDEDGGLSQLHLYGSMFVRNDSK